VHFAQPRYLFIAAILFTFVLALFGQSSRRDSDAPKVNPLAGDPKAIRRGELLFRQDCAPCHGIGAKGGGRGPDLTTGVWNHGGTDAEIRNTILKGVPGTEMPGHDREDVELWQTIAYLRTLTAKVPPTPIGDARHGEQLFFGDANCSLCHMVAGRGGRLGPELTRVGAARSRAYLIDSIREPSKNISDERYYSATAVTRDGKQLQGVPMNEDAFTVQLMDTDEKIHSLVKKDLKSYKVERKSPMPIYNEDLLSTKDMNDVVAYMETLRGRKPATMMAEGEAHAK
jgi:cytochrome c oxidase cbb3-type subunit III